ncbi:MAG: hypothetical protein IPP94_10125 [Ignavibacteria bacterium]|nr:hypothetical protein [Ignavibacteria bacterium]
MSAAEARSRSRSMFSISAPDAMALSLPRLIASMSVSASSFEDCSRSARLSRSSMKEKAMSPAASIPPPASSRRKRREPMGMEEKKVFMC